jgi:hypothetical protein
VGEEELEWSPPRLRKILEATSRIIVFKSDSVILIWDEATNVEQG